jgi:hypothetical protein
MYPTMDGKSVPCSAFFIVSLVYSLMRLTSSWDEGEVAKRVLDPLNVED